MIEIVPITKVKADRSNLSSYLVKKMMKVLERQGQIEPLAVNLNYEVYESDAWSAEIVQAALNLGWATLLVAVLTETEAREELGR